MIAIQREASHPLSIAFFVLWLVPTLLALPPVVAALVFGRDLPRRAAVTSIQSAFILSGAVYSILLVARIFDGHLRPSAGLCAAQASLVAGLDMLMICTIMGMIYAILSEVRDAKKGASYKAASRTRKPLSRAFLIAPYVSWVVLAMFSAVLFTRGGYTPYAASFYATNAHLPYCTPKDGIIDLVMFFASIALWAVAFFFAIGVLFAYMRTRREPEPWAAIDHAAVTRDAVVVGVLLVVMGARASYVPLVINPAPDFALAITATFVAIVYGLQAEVLRAWRRWLRLEHAYTQVGARGPHGLGL